MSSLTRVALCHSSLPLSSSLPTNPRSANPNLTDHRGNNALHAIAAGECAKDGFELDIDLARRLCKGGTPAAAPSEAAATAATAAAATATPSPKVDPGAVNHDGVTPVHLAAQRGKTRLLCVLAEFDAPLTATDRSGRDAHSYVSDGHTEKVLLSLIGDATVKEASTRRGRRAASCRGTCSTRTGARRARAAGSGDGRRRRAAPRPRAASQDGAPV